MPILKQLHWLPGPNQNAYPRHKGSCPGISPQGLPYVLLLSELLPVVAMESNFSFVAQPSPGRVPFLVFFCLLFFTNMAEFSFLFFDLLKEFVIFLMLLLCNLMLLPFALKVPFYCYIVGCFSSCVVF